MVLRWYMRGGSYYIFTSSSDCCSHNISAETKNAIAIHSRIQKQNLNKQHSWIHLRRLLRVASMEWDRHFFYKIVIYCELRTPISQETSIQQQKKIKIILYRSIITHFWTWSNDEEKRRQRGRNDRTMHAHIHPYNDRWRMGDARERMRRRIRVINPQESNTQM